MNREEKKVVIDSLAEKLTAYAHYYITDTSELERRADRCFEKALFRKGSEAGGCEEYVVYQGSRTDRED